MSFTPPKNQPRQHQQNENDRIHGAGNRDDSPCQRSQRNQPDKQTDVQPQFLHPHPQNPRRLLQGFLHLHKPIASRCSRPLNRPMLSVHR